jgi:ABC-type multidrug transport system fused ATPase/permease subunit
MGRVQLAELFDSVMVLERGKIVEQGPFDELKSSNEHFQHLLVAE